MSNEELLAIIKDRGKILQRELMDITGMKKSTLSARVLKLQNAGLITISKYRQGRSYISEISLTKEGVANLRKGLTPSKQPSEPEELPSHSNEELPEEKGAIRPSYKREVQKIFQDSPWTLILSLIRKHNGVLSKRWAQEFCRCYEISLAKFNEVLTQLAEKGLISQNETQIMLRLVGREKFRM